MIPHILYNDPVDLINEIKSASTVHADKEQELKKLILENSSIDRYLFSVLSGNDFLNYVLVCLSYSRLDSEIVNVQTFKDKLKSNLSQVMSELNLEGSPVVYFPEELKKEIYSTLGLF